MSINKNKQSNDRYTAEYVDQMQHTKMDKLKLKIPT